MALTRFNGNVVPFASESTTDNRTVFGDVVQADDIDSNLNADFKKGWEIVGLNDNPTKQDFNAMGYTLGALISYLYQMGIAEYNASQEYKLNAVCIGTDGTIYQSLVDANIGNALNDVSKWKNVTESYVTLTGDQTIDGVKTFSSTISGNINGSATSATTLSNRGAFPTEDGQDFNTLTTTGVYLAKPGDFSGTLNSPGRYGTLFVSNASPYVSQLFIALDGRIQGRTAESSNWSDWVGYVALTDNQTIAGVKTFSSSPIAPTPTIGDNSTKVATTAFVKTSSIGVGQTWQNVTASRSAGVTYTNTTGKPIQIALEISYTGTGVRVITIDGITYGGEFNYAFSYTFIIPNNSTYSINASVDTWLELR